MAFGSKVVLSVLYFIAIVENHIFCVGIIVKFVVKKKIKYDVYKKYIKV
jgi:hypothetical protein